MKSEIEQTRITICRKFQSFCLNNAIPLNKDTSISPLDVVRTHNLAASRVASLDISPPKTLTVCTGINKYINTDMAGKIQVMKK